MKITTARTRLEILGEEDARLMLDYQCQNRIHFAPWEPNRDEEFYTLAYWQNFLPQHAEQLQNQTAIRFVALTPDRSEVIGTCNFTGITKAAFQACFVGYSVAEKYQGQGYMPEILEAALEYVFNTVGSHRVMATYMPSNEHTYAHAHQISAWIVEQWGIVYTVSGLNKWLHQHGFTYKKPKGVPHKTDADKQAKFVEKYETLKAGLSESEVLLFMDAVHPTQATKVTSGWIRKGVAKIINTTGSRTRMNIVGAIELNDLSAAVFDQFETVNGQSIISFFNKVRCSYASMEVIHMVLDGAGYHRSQEVVDEAEKLGIKLHYLPPYSPNLNPIERLWKVMNEYVRNNEYFATAKEFRRKINHFLNETLPQIGASLASRINDNFQMLNSAS